MHKIRNVVVACSYRCYVLVSIIFAAGTFVLHFAVCNIYVYFPKTNGHLSCENEDFVETRLCKLCVRDYDRAYDGLCVYQPHEGSVLLNQDDAMVGASLAL